MRPSILAALLGEVVRELRAHVVTATAGGILVAAVVVIVSLTYGRAVATAGEALKVLDTSATRTVVVTIQPGAELGAERLQLLGELSTVSEVLHLGPARDAVNATTYGQAVSLRDCYLVSARSSCPTGATRAAAGGPATLEFQGFVDGVGMISDGRETYVIHASNDEMFAEGGVLADSVVAGSPSSMTASERIVSMVVIVAETRGAVAPIVATARDLLSGVEASQYSVDHKLDLIEASEALDQTLLQASRAQATLALVVAGVMLALSELSVARTRRKYAGLRRALGARRSHIVMLASFTALSYGSTGVLFGVAAAVGICTVLGLVVPPYSFMLAVGVLTLLVVAAAALLPAIYSATRQPARELRTP